MRMRAVAVLALSAAAAAAGSGCKQKRIAVADQSSDTTGDYGRVELDKAVATFQKQPTSPAAYRALALEVQRLDPVFNQPVRDTAERQLAFLALEPMAAQIDRSPEEQVEALALTVWPTAFNVEPNAGETARAYLERVCSGPLATECKYVVPERWPTVLAAMVWRRMKMRAREAYSQCRLCKQDTTFPAMLEKFDQFDNRMQAERARLGDRADRDAWPEAGEHMAPWSGAPLLDLVADPFEWNGEEFDGDWQDRIRGRPEGADVLGLHVRPRTEVRHVRAVVAAAARAGYRAVALQVRGRTYPYPLGEYRIAAARRGGRGESVDIRDVDTVQILARALDAAAGRAGGAASGAPPIRLAGR
ncbi:MAG TPA: hypothetical protein VFU21_09175 [Kofleriaceae bacterium]|nr:hypothetical protein [Kofleriaceae bacterium]